MHLFTSLLHHKFLYNPCVIGGINGGVALRALCMLSKKINGFSRVDSAYFDKNSLSPRLEHCGKKKGMLNILQVIYQ